MEIKYKRLTDADEVSWDVMVAGRYKLLEVMNMCVLFKLLLIFFYTLASLFSFFHVH
jgi:hypothetical protein